MGGRRYWWNLLDTERVWGVHGLRVLNKNSRKYNFQKGLFAVLES